MNSLDALKSMVRAYPGGPEVVALRLGKALSTLEKELAGSAFFKLGAQDAEAITEMCAEQGVPNAHAYAECIASRARVDVKLRPPAQARPVDVMRGNCEVLKEVADVVAAATNAAGDKVPTANEVRAVEREAGEAVAAIHHLVADVRARHAEGKPAHLHEAAKPGNQRQPD